MQAHRRLLTAVAALWALPEDTLEQYLTLRKPALVQTDSDLHVGRANLSKSAPEGESRSRKPAKAALKQVNNLFCLFCERQTSIL